MDQAPCLNITIEKSQAEEWSWKKDEGPFCLSQDGVCKHLTKDQLCDTEKTHCRNWMDQAPCLNETIEKTQAEGGSWKKDRGVFCLSQDGGWKHLTKHQLCDEGKVHCKNLMDQSRCMISTVKQTNAEGGSLTEEDGVICFDKNRNKWLPVPSDKVCDKSFDCKNHFDETVCFEKKIYQTKTIVLNGVGPALAGVYKRKQLDGIEYYAQRGKKLGLIYQLSRKEGLVIGKGKDIWSATALFRREGETVWKDVEDGTLKGRWEGDPKPDVRLTWVPDAFDLSLFKSRQHKPRFEKETKIPGLGIICLSAKSQEQTFVPFNDQTAGWCDRIWQCQFGGSFNNF